MDSRRRENEKELLGDSEKLMEYLGTRIDEMAQVLDDEQAFCDKEIQATMNYTQTIEAKFLGKIKEFKVKLEQFRKGSIKTSEQSKRQFDDEMQVVNDLFTAGKHSEALNKLADYERQFAQRKKLTDDTPKLRIKESDIEQFFTSDPPLQIQSTAVINPPIRSPTRNDDELEEVIATDKERLRRQKVVERVIINKDDQEIEQDDKGQPATDISSFGARSKRTDNQGPPPLPTHSKDTTTTIDTKSPLTIPTVRPLFRFSTRLGPTSDSQHLSLSKRNIAPSPVVQTHDVHLHEDQTQVRSTTTPPDSVCSFTGRPPTFMENNQAKSLILDLVSYYQHEQNSILLMASDAHHIVLYKSPRNRLDRWHLGAIERSSRTERSLAWHDGLIISMGSVKRDTIYMFTESAFFLYSIHQCRNLTSRMLPRGNDDGSDLTNPSHNEFCRGIGTVYDTHMYHIYLNRKDRWTLSKTSFERLIHIHDCDLTSTFPDVERFIHFCVNDKTISFLVQTWDSSYAVVFCSVNDCSTNEYNQVIYLLNAQQPLTICSAFIQSLNQYIFFINDPSIDILHIINTKQYLRSDNISAYAICVADKYELMIVTKNSICSVKLNESKNFIF